MQTHRDPKLHAETAKAAAAPGHDSGGGRGDAAAAAATSSAPAIDAPADGVRHLSQAAHLVADWFAGMTPCVCCVLSTDMHQLHVCCVYQLCWWNEFNLVSCLLLFQGVVLSTCRGT